MGGVNYIGAFAPKITKNIFKHLAKLKQSGSKQP